MARELGLEAYPAPSYTGPGARQPGSLLFYSTRELAGILKYGAERLGR